MASPSFTTVWSELKNVVLILDDTRNYGSVNGTNLVTDLNTYVTALAGDRAASGGVASQQFRAQFAALLAGGRSLLDPHIFDMAKAISSPGQDVATILADLYLYMNDNSYTVVSREYTFGSVSAGGSNVGTGTVYRLTTDSYNNAIEVSFPTTTTLKCVQDSQSGTSPGREVFQIYQVQPAPDLIETAGSGTFGTLTGLAGDVVLRNASFQNLAGSVSAPTDIPNWTSSIAINGTNYQFDATNYFRVSPEESANNPAGGGTPYGLRMYATATLTQKVRYLNLALSPSTPYFFALRWNRQVGACTGTLKITIGTKSTTVSVTTQTGWQTLVVAMDQNLWLRQFNQDNLGLVIDWTLSTGTYLVVDDACFAPMTRYDGLWYTYLGGATNAQKDDKYTFADTELGNKVQRWLWRLYGRYLPAGPKTPATACTAALAGAGAGNVNNGTHVYAITVTDAAGRESAVGPSSTAVNVVDATTNGKVSLTAIPTGDAATSNRKVYRSAAGTTTPLKLLTTISDNTTTTYTDNTADASLGATVNALTQITDP